MRDPVCGMHLSTSEHPLESSYLGCKYWFCSATCQERFDANPREYLSDSSLGA